MAGSRLKRALDLSIAAPALTLSLPLQAVVAVAVRRQLGSPILFRQTRPGLNAHPFEMVKFRTMKPPHAAQSGLCDEERMTPLGRILRSTSLDELPTLWNVVRGDMSLVGPRPLLMEYLGRYSREQARRHEVLPGMTGLAQVSGRNGISWEEKFRLDVHYVDHQSLRLDLTILMQTLLTVLKREGVSAAGQATMPPFLGK